MSGTRPGGRSGIFMIASKSRRMRRVPFHPAEKTRLGLYPISAPSVRM